MRHLLSRSLVALCALFAAGGIWAQTPQASDRTAQNLARTHQLAQCMVREFRPLVVRVLEQAPGSAAEGGRLQELRRRGRRCADAIAKIDRDTQYLADFQLSPVDFRGGLAEALYEHDFSPANRIRPRALARVAAPARAAAAAGAETRPDELPGLRRFAFCVVGAAPESAAVLLAMEPSSPSEIDAVRRFVSEYDFCFPSNASLNINVPTVRGFIAEAVYRHYAAVARGEPAGSLPGEQIARRGSTGSGAVVIVPTAVQGAGSGNEGEAYTGEDVRVLTQFSRCIAQRRPAEARALLALDYSSDEYDRAARDRASRSAMCKPEGRLRFSRVLFAGGLAEQLLSEALGGAPLPSRISAAAQGPALAPRDSTESVALCLVRSRPDGVAALLATQPGSPEETRVVRELASPVADCVGPGQVARISQSALRALSAIAAWRLVQQSAPRGAAGSRQ